MGDQYRTTKPRESHMVLKGLKEASQNLGFFDHRERACWKEVEYSLSTNGDGRRCSVCNRRESAGAGREQERRKYYFPNGAQSCGLELDSPFRERYRVI